MAEAVTLPQAVQPGSGLRGAWRWLRHYLPEGRGLPQEEWRIRHRAVVVFILAHAVGLAIFGLVRGWPAPYALGEGALIAALGGLAAVPALSRKMRSSVAALGCVASSAVLVQFWGGVIEAHFHFFVVVALISLYQDWVPFLLCVAFVALDHGVAGTLASEWVYNHPSALAAPWRWALIHAAMVLAECVALIVVWRANEQARSETDRILRSAGEGLLGVDAECRVTFANPAALKMAGGSESLVGQPLYMMLLGDDGRPLFSGPEVLRQNPGAFSLVAWLSRTDAPPLPVEVLCTPIEGLGHQEGAVVAVRDITDRLRIEEERTQSALQTKELQQLREVSSFKTRFMNMAAHELNTPLTPIKVQMHLLKAKAASGPLDQHRGSIDILHRNFERLSGLVQELLDSTRLQSDRLNTAPRPMDLDALLRDLGESFRPAAEEAHLRLDMESPGPLPCVADPQRLSQAVSNLLVNALKFTPAGGRVTLRAAELGANLRIEVTDTGIGLSEAQIARLFQPFEQVHESQTSQHHGSGLGLYITRGIVQMHGGRAWVESGGPGKGSSFVLEFPRQAPARGATAA